MAFAGINYWAVVLAAVAGWLVGAAWYSVLARQWLIALEKTRTELLRPSGKPSPVPFIISFLAELVMAWVFAGILGHFGEVTLFDGVVSGFFIWLGFVLTAVVVNYSFARQRFMLTVIDGGHWLVVLLIQGAILGLFGAS